jgi:ectoine hydroxylase-related dioxygenase (phytanoyl-CoA dioxygenase family)
MSVEANTGRVAAVANPGQREQFERDGYIVIDGVAGDEAIDAIVAELSDLYGQRHHSENGVIYYPNRIQDAWRINEKVKQVALEPVILKLLADLYGRPPLPFQTINFRVGTQQKPHSDALHFSTVPAGFMAGVWVALEDMTMDKGPLVYYPGSQKFPYVTMADVGVAAKSENYGDYERFVEELIDREGLEPHYATIRKGQALVWAANLLHGGAPQSDRSLSRHSQVTHYFFEGCRYFTPMLSEGEDVRWRDPIRIG